MSQPITEQDYWQEIRSLAEAIVSKAKERGGDIHEAIQEILQETIDGHQWVIYTWYAQQVLVHSKNDGAIEEFGMDSVVKDGVLQWSVIAYCAMEADVRDHLPDYAELEEMQEQEA